MAYESPEELGPVKRGARASDPKGYSTAFELNERKKDGETPASQKPDGGGPAWTQMLGLGLVATALFLGFRVLRKPKKPQV